MSAQPTNSRLFVIQAPTGRFIFAGSVPTTLAFDACDEDRDRAVLAGPRLARLIAEREGREFKTISFASKQEALDEAERQGYRVTV